LKNLAAEERLLGGETAQLTPRFAGPQAFAFALEAASRNMRRASTLLVRGETETATQDVERAALLRMEQTLNGLGSDAPSQTKNTAAGEQGSPSERNTNASTAEIKLVRLLQQTINERTAELETMRARRGELNTEQKQELDALALEQGRLADMVLEWIKTTGQRPENNPEAK